MATYEVSEYTYSKISKNMELFHDKRMNYDDIRDDIIGNHGIRNTYVKLGFKDEIEVGQINSLEGNLFLSPGKACVNEYFFL